MRKLYVILLPVLVALLHGAYGIPVAHAADNGNWSVYPASPPRSAGGTPAEPGRRPCFYLSADPGATLTDQVTVTNKTAAPLTFRLYAADAYNTERDGGFAVRTLKEKQRGVGAWAKPGRDRVTVPGNSSVTVPYTMHVPEDAEPGDHPGALVALDEHINPSTGPLAVGIQQAVGARIYLRVNGPTVPALSVENVTLTHEQPLLPGTGESSALISYTLYNRGNVTLNPKVALKAEGLFGRDLLNRDLKMIPAELLPRQKIRLTERWAGAPQLEWGEVRLTASARDVRESAGTSFFALPWLVAVVLSAGLLGAGVWARVRRVRARVPEGS
ncbi:WxL protein peptidoglycan domain-containing protein [Streptomyces sp. NPDC002926]